jgi:hypothetical protein
MLGFKNTDPLTESRMLSKGISAPSGLQRSQDSINFFGVAQHFGAQLKLSCNVREALVPEMAGIICTGHLSSKRCHAHQDGRMSIIWTMWDNAISGRALCLK